MLLISSLQKQENEHNYIGITASCKKYLIKRSKIKSIKQSTKINSNNFPKDKL